MTELDRSASAASAGQALAPVDGLASRAARHLAPYVLVSVGIVAWHLPPPDGAVASWRVTVVVVAAIVAWALSLAPDYVIALGLVTVYHAAHLGPATVGLSGFASAGWFLLIGVLSVAVALVRSGLLERLALGLLLACPRTFRGQAGALVVVGLVVTPLLPLTVARCALIAPLASRVAHLLGYTAQSRPAVGLGLAAFLGSGLLARSFLSGATLNLIAWNLLPADARLSWTAWAVAAAPLTLVVLGGSLATIFWRFRPAAEPPLAMDGITDHLARLGRPTSHEWITGAVAAATLLGFIIGPRFGLDSSWIACGAALCLMGAGVLTRQDIRSGVDWTLLIFLGVILSLPAVLEHAGLDRRVAAALADGLPSAASPAVAVVGLLLATTAARFMLSEWVGVPVLTVAFLPLAPALGLHPWVVAFVVLIGSNAWFLPYQFASYATFLAASEGQLFRPRQAMAFSAAYLALCAAGLIVSLPFWRLLGLIR